MKLAQQVDTKLEVVVIPVSDVDRAKRFYADLGWRLDADFAFDNGFRVVQFTPPGSACSIQFGTKITSAEPGSAQGTYLVVSDIDAVRDDLAARGAQVSDVFHPTTPGAQFGAVAAGGRAVGRESDAQSYRSFATFRDPDGNGWLLQEITKRLDGRGFGNLDVTSLTELLREAELRHGEYEPTAPTHHWSAWYAAFVIARQTGKTAEEAVRDATQRIENASHPSGQAAT
jgi:catechol 2,3-dioxygenase-like lactoylglutathione lyase family enzyme